MESPRRALVTDRESIERLAALSFGSLAPATYDPSIVAACLPFVARLDPRLFDATPYFVIDGEDGPIAAGGWSAIDDHGWTKAAARGLTAQVRALWVHPERARQGLGRRIMATIEADARAAGHGAMGVRASLNSVPFYAALGYRVRGASEVPLADGVTLSAALMAKTLA